MSRTTLAIVVALIGAISGIVSAFIMSRSPAPIVIIIPSNPQPNPSVIHIAPPVWPIFYVLLPFPDDAKLIVGNQQSGTCTLQAQVEGSEPIRVLSQIPIGAGQQGEVSLPYANVDQRFVLRCLENPDFSVTVVLRAIPCWPCARPTSVPPVPIVSATPSSQPTLTPEPSVTESATPKPTATSTASPTASPTATATPEIPYPPPSPTAEPLVIAATEGWQVGYPVAPGDVVSLSFSEGEWAVDPGYGYFGPNGLGDDAGMPASWQTQCRILPNAPLGALLMQVVNADDQLPVYGPVAVGEHFDFDSEVSGLLQLSINDSDSCRGDNQGSLTYGVARRQGR